VRGEEWRVRGKAIEREAAKPKGAKNRNRISFSFKK
jgi:hypothetical protein